MQAHVKLGRTPELVVTLNNEPICSCRPDGTAIGMDIHVNEGRNFVKRLREQGVNVPERVAALWIHICNNARR